MIDVFLSYRRASGSEFASFLNEKLKKLGYEVFFDSTSLREGTFEDKIDQAIDQCTFFLLLLAPGDLKRSIENPDSDWIIYESKRALKEGKIIIPIAIKEGFEFPEHSGNQIIEALSKINICNLYGCNAAELIESRLLQFMNDLPSKQLSEDYQKGIIDSDYLTWEVETIKNIYFDIPLLHEFGREYAAFAISGSKSVTYPFDSLTKNGSLQFDNKTILYDDSPYYEAFKKIVGPNIHYPHLYGYTSNGFQFDEEQKICGLHAIPRTYIETVFTCHILQYELWDTYKKLDGKRPAKLDDLPMRNKIHKNRNNKEVIFSGCNRSALNDVTVAIIVYDDWESEYKIAVAQRNEKVATYPGYYGFVPSGGFELYELEDSQSEYIIKENFSVIGAVFREYMEEIFGDEHFEKATGNDDLNRLHRSPRIQELQKGIKEGSYKFEFLGVDFDLITLRQTLAFVLRIDDKDFLLHNEICRNSENKSIKLLSLSKFEQQLTDSKVPIMTESAATYALLKKNHLYQEILNNNFGFVKS